MNKVLDKVRKFIIRKLGGYTSQYRIDGKIPKATYTNCTFEVYINQER